MSRVSIVIPCYNQGRYLLEAIGSVRAQDFADTEIIVVDDASTDAHTQDVLADLRREGITVVTLEKNGGLSNARNAGIAAAEGGYVLPLDADDRIGPGYLSAAVAVLDADPTVGIVYSRAAFFGERKGGWDLPPYSLETMLLGNCIFASALFRRADWGKVGGYRTEMRYGWEDWDFWLSLIEAGAGVRRLDGVFFNYRVHMGSMVRAMTDAQRLEMRREVFLRHQGLYVGHIEVLLSHLDVEGIRFSLSYRLGRMLTRPLAWLRDLFRP